MIKNYIIMKKNEIKVKSAVYGMIASVMDNHKEVIEFAQKLFTALKDVSPEDMQKELVSKIAELVHQNNNNTEKNVDKD